MPTTLTDLINAIPVAEDGHVISRHHHNTIREALLRIASQLDPSGAGGVETISFAPNFAQNNNDFNWIVADGIAGVSLGDERNIVNGILPVQFPNGARLNNFTARGRRAGAVVSFTLKFLRFNVSDGDVTTLASLPNLRTASDPFTVTQNVASEAAIVDNQAYTYAITARAQGVTDAIQLFSFAIAYSRG